MATSQKARMRPYTLCEGTHTLSLGMRALKAETEPLFIIYYTSVYGSASTGILQQLNMNCESAWWIMLKMKRAAAGPNRLLAEVTKYPYTITQHNIAYD